MNAIRIFKILLIKLTLLSKLRQFLKSLLEKIFFNFFFKFAHKTPKENINLLIT